MDNLLPLKVVAEKYCIETHVLNHAIQKGLIKGLRKEGKWYITEAEYQKYVSRKFDRAKKLDPEKNEISVTQCSLLFGRSRGRIHQLIKLGRLKVERRGKMYVLKFDDCKNLFTKNNRQESFL